MAILNERNENTKGVIHLLTTTLCNRDCKYCCNKQYDMNEILYVTDSELREAHTLCLTGGEPFSTLILAQWQSTINCAIVIFRMCMFIQMRWSWHSGYKLIHFMILMA